MSNRKHKYNPLYKNFLRLKVNPLNNNKFLKLKLKLIKHRMIKDRYTKQKKRMPVKRWEFVKNSKKEKWKEFLESQIRAQSFFNRFKPYTAYSYKTNKFASKGNSFKKNFKNNLLTKLTFSYLYGGLQKKYLKLKMTEIYRSKTSKNPINICTEFFESRLDSVLYKAKFCKSIKNAQQMISHNHVQVNGRVEKNKACNLKKGDIITFKLEALTQIKTNLKKTFNECPDLIIWPVPPNYLNINYKTLEITMGDINNYNFSNLFTLKQDISSTISNGYRN